MRPAAAISSGPAASVPRWIEEIRLHYPAVAAAFERVPRTAFLPARARLEAEEDTPVPLGVGGATISAPTMVATMLVEADLRPGQRCVEVGSGSGYLLALVAELLQGTGTIHGVEIEPRLAGASRRTLRNLGYGPPRVVVHCADGVDPDRRHGPFDRLIASCAIDAIPPAWVTTLAPDGLGVVPLGPPYDARLAVYTRRSGGAVVRWGPACSFVPFRRPPRPDI